LEEANELILKLQTMISEMQLIESASDAALDIAKKGVG